MNSVRQERHRTARRTLGVLGAALVLAAACAGGGLAGTGKAAGADQAGSLPPGFTPEMKALVDEAVARQDQLAAERDTPAARQARQDSATAFESLSAAEALATAEQEHATLLLGAPAWQPLEAVVPGAEVERYYDGGLGARVDVPGTPADAFVQSTVPLRTDASGEEAPLDLTLKDQGDEIEPKAPLVETTIPAELDDAVALGNPEISLAPPGAEDAAPARLSDDTAFFANVAPDTDFMVQPAPTGAQALFQLRSARSPETVELDFELPAGASLAKGGELGGAHVVRDGEDLAQVTMPIAFDAEGWPVELTDRVEGDRMVIEVPHRDQDVAYPVAVDPVISEGASSFTDHSGWTSSKWPAGAANPTFHQGPGYLYVFGDGGSTTYQPYQYGRWTYESPGPEVTMYIAELHTVVTSQANGRTVAQQGIYDPAAQAWDTGTVLEGGFFPNSPISTGATFQVPKFTHCIGQNIYCIGGTPGNEVMFQIVSTYNGTIPAGFMHYIGGAVVWMLDETEPQVQFEEDTPMWVDDELDVVTEARDDGLGVKKFHLTLDNDPQLTRTHDCAGGAADRCPGGGFTASDGSRVSGDDFNLDTSELTEGEHTLYAGAEDLLGNATAPSEAEHDFGVDHTGPELEVSGTLKDAVEAEQELDPQGTYDVSVDATDDLSGVTKIEFLLDDEPIESVEDPCPDGGCSLDLTASIDASEYDPGAQEFAVAATNAGGYANVEELNATIPGPPAQPDSQHLPCTETSEPTNFDTYSLGPELEGLDATTTTRRCDEPDPAEPIRANYVSHTYGVCEALVPPAEPTPEDACAPPLEIQTWPSCERSIADYELEPGVAYPVDGLGPLDEDGAFAYLLDGGTRAEVYTGASTIVIMGDDPAVVEDALDAVQEEPGAEPPSPPSEPPAGGEELQAPDEGATEGALSCDGGIDETAEPPQLAPDILAAPPPAAYPQAGSGCDDAATAPVGVVFHHSQDASAELQDAGFDTSAGEPEQALPAESAGDPACLDDGADLADEEAGTPDTREAVSVWEQDPPADPQAEPLPPEVATAKAQEMTSCGWALDPDAGEGSAFDEARREVAAAMDQEHDVETVYWGNTRSVQGIDDCATGSPGIVSEASDGAVAAVGYPEDDPEPLPEPTCEGEPATMSATAGDGANEIAVAPGDVVVAGQDDTVVGADPEDAVCQLPESELPPPETVGRMQSAANADVEASPAGPSSPDPVFEHFANWPWVQNAYNALSKPFGYHDDYYLQNSAQGAQRVIKAYQGGADFVRVPLVGCPKSFVVYEPIHGWGPLEDVAQWAGLLDMTILLNPMWKRSCAEAARPAPPRHDQGGAWWRFVYDAVDHVNDLGAAAVVEPWNEPNLAEFWCKTSASLCPGWEYWYATAYIHAYYGAFVAEVVNGMNVPVMLSAPGKPRASCPGDRMDYVCVKAWLKGVKGYLDGAKSLGLVELSGAHIYPNSANPISRSLTRERALEQFKLVRNVFPENWRKTLVTEAGMRSAGKKKFTAKYQCNRLLDIYNKLMTHPGAAGLTVFKLEDLLPGEAGYKEKIASMGTMDHNLSPKAAWTWLLKKRTTHSNAGSCG